MLKTFLQRPVEWILWNPSNETGLIIVSEEAEILIPIIRAVRRPKVHLITYAAPVTKSMMHFNSLAYYVLPQMPSDYKMSEWLSVELGIFAGRLYAAFPDCSFVEQYLQMGKNEKTASEGNNERGKTPVKDPANFLLHWLTICRKGQEIIHTPMGYISQGRSLHRNHTFLSQNANAKEVIAMTVRDRTSYNQDTDEESIIRIQMKIRILKMSGIT